MSPSDRGARVAPTSPQAIERPSLQRSNDRARLDTTARLTPSLSEGLSAWPHWSLLSRGVAFLGIVASLWRLNSLVALGAILGLHGLLIALSQAALRSNADGEGAKVDVHLLVITLVFSLNTSFVTYALPFAPLGAFMVAAALVLSPAQRHLILITLIFTLELGWALKYASSVVEASTHALVYGVGLSLMMWLLWRLKRAGVGLVEPRSSGGEYVSATLYELPSGLQSFDEAIGAPAPDRGASPEANERGRSEVGAEVGAEVDAEMIFEATAQELSPDFKGGDLERSSEGRAQAPLSQERSSQAPNAYYGSSASGEHDLGLATRQVKPFAPPEHLDNIRQHAQEQRKRPLEFLDLSCAITLGHLAEQLNADSAVLIWRRNKSGGREAAVRWRWTKRPSDLWQARYFSVDQDLIREAMGTEGVFHLSQAEGWDGALPYYLPDFRVAQMLAVPICPYGVGDADGLLIVDRDLAEPWTDAELDASFRLAQKINLDVDISRFMKQLVHNSGLSDALLLGLSNLNESEEQGGLAQALLEGVIVHDVCRWVAVCALQGEQVVLLSSWGKDQPLYLDGERYPIGADGVSLCLKTGQVIEAGAPVARSPELEPLARVEMSEIFPFPSPALERCASVHIKPLCDPYGEEVHGAIILGVEHQALLTAPYINPLELIIDEAAVKMSWLHAHEQLRQLAMIDGLTSLFNHRSFQSELDQILKRARRTSRSTALILLDIDHFKSINDSYGHPFGDQVLKGVAEALRESMREVDLVARYGGEEFSIALEDSSLEDVKIAAERARVAVEALSFNHKGEEVKVTISLGVALFPSDASDKVSLIDRADQSLYEAKRKGRNQVRLWSESSHDERNPSRMWTRHPVASSQELRGLDALISPSGDELKSPNLFDTRQQRLLEERALRADGRVLAEEALSQGGADSELESEPKPERKPETEPKP